MTPDDIILAMIMIMGEANDEGIRSCSFRKWLGAKLAAGALLRLPEVGEAGSVYRS